MVFNGPYRFLLVLNNPYWFELVLILVRSSPYWSAVSRLGFERCVLKRVEASSADRLEGVKSFKRMHESDAAVFEANHES